jgi:hypothetical protein
VWQWDLQAQQRRIKRTKMPRREQTIMTARTAGLGEEVVMIVVKVGCGGKVVWSGLVGMVKVVVVGGNGKADDEDEAAA